MDFTGTWMTESESVIYRVVPKCACSTIGQILYYSDHGKYFDGDIHDATEGLHNFSFDHCKPIINDKAVGRNTYAFTSVRNPYNRILSAFFDKICGIQRNGGRYRGKFVHRFSQKYGFEIWDEENSDDFDQIRNFRRFLLFARDTVHWRRPITPDIHWIPMSNHISWYIRGGGHFRSIISTENFGPEMQNVLDSINSPSQVNLSQTPRFNESEGHGPKRAHPVEDYFDDLSMHLVREIYHRDFDLFKYDFDNPANKMPIGEIDLDEVHAKLGQ